MTTRPSAIGRKTYDPSGVEEMSETRPELILLPGLMCDADLWRDVIAGLAGEADCRGPDLSRGETLAELARSVLDEAAPTFALAAFSFGGYVAQEIARQAPGRRTPRAARHRFG